MLNPDTVLAPDRSYVWWATWPNARPSKKIIITALSRFPYGQATDAVAVPVLNVTTDVTANGVIYPLQPVPVENVLAELAAIGADIAQVHDWPEGIAGNIARGYWDRLIKAGIDGQKTVDEIGAGTRSVIRWVAVLGAISLGVFWAVR